MTNVSETWAQWDGDILRWVAYWEHWIHPARGSPILSNAVSRDFKRQSNGMKAVESQRAGETQDTKSWHQLLVFGPYCLGPFESQFAHLFFPSSFPFFYWSLVDLQCCVSFRYTANWVIYSWDGKKSDTTERLNWTDVYIFIFLYIFIYIVFQIIFPYRLL